MCGIIYLKINTILVINKYHYEFVVQLFLINVINELYNYINETVSIK